MTPGRFAASSIGVAALLVASPPLGLIAGFTLGFIVIRKALAANRADRARVEWERMAYWRGTQADLSNFSIEERNAYRRTANNLKRR